LELLFINLNFTLRNIKSSKMKSITFIVLIFLSLWTNPIYSQLTIDGQFRSRAELRNGYRELASETNFAALLVSQRSRLILNHNDSNFVFRFSAQDARVWGQNWNQMPNNALHLHEAWAAYKVNKQLMLKVGRQELKYDDQRLLAVRDYSITGVTYDAALLLYNNNELELNFHWGAMINNMVETNFLVNYHFPLSFKYMSFFWFEKNITDALQTNAIYLIDLTQKAGEPQTMFARNTVGANAIFGLTDYWGVRVGGYYQFGEHWMNFGTFGEEQVKVRAYSYNASIWLSPLQNFKVSANIDTYSGHDWSTSSDYFSGFNRLLAAGHAHMGFMDYFTSVDLREVTWAGMNDLFLRVDYKVSSKFNLQATTHYFLLNKPNLKALWPFGYITVDKELGTELDLVANYRINSSFAIQLAFMSMFPSSTMELIKLNGGEPEFSYFSYVSLLFTPKLFEK
jgi:hypothetical protein